MLRIIMNSGVVYEIDWHQDSFFDECYGERGLCNGFISIYDDVFINPSHISSIEIIED